MNDNKKNKTFSDLFSNIEEKNNDKKKIDFNSMTKELKTDNKEIEKSENLFNIAAKEEKNSLNSLINESKNKIEEKNNSSFNSLIKESVNKEEKNTNDNNKEEVATLNNLFSKAEEDNDTEPKESNNLFKNETIDNKEETEKNQEDNILFKDDNQHTKEEVDEQEDSILEDNNDKENETIDDIFSKTEENNDIESKESNDLFKNETIDNIEETEKDQKDNILFQDNNIKEEENIENEKPQDDTNTEDKKENEKDKVDNEIDENPFFTDTEQTEEINPFYDNNINLVENNSPSKLDETNLKIDTSNAKHFNVKIVKKKDPPLKFIIGVLSYALFIWLLLIGVALLVYVADIKIRAARGDNSTPSYNAYVVLTGSMLPDIQVFDVVITKKIEPKSLKEGDIITFASSDTRFLNTIITHRIIKKYYDAEKKEYTFQTKGDNNNVADSALVQSNNIFGKVILKIPKLGYLQEFLASKGGWIIAILLPCVAVIAYDIVKLSKGLKRKKYKNIKVQSR